MQKKRARIRVNRKKTGIIQTHIRNNLRNYCLVTIIFLVGIILGVLFINNANETQEKEISSYINDFVGKTKENANIDYIKLFITSIKKNLSFALLLWIAGLTVFGVFVVYGAVCFKGFCLGYSVASAIATLGIKNGSIFIFSSMLLQNIVLIPTIFALSISGIRLYKSIMKDKRRDNIKLEVLRHTCFCAIVSVMLFVASFMETYISSNIFMSTINIL